MKFRLLILVILSIFAANAKCEEETQRTAEWVGSNLKGIPCEGRPANYGPFDYSTEAQKYATTRLYMVEHAHFTKSVENLVRGQTGIELGQDLDYTIIAWPNHPRALLSIIKFQLNVLGDIIDTKTLGKPKNSPECYLQRAIHFNPKDPVPYDLYGYYLRKLGHLEDAVKYHKKALELAPNNEKFAYSYGLLLIDLKRYEEAAEVAKIAYKDGKAPLGLKRKLEKIGVWKE